MGGRSIYTQLCFEPIIFWPQAQGISIKVKQPPLCIVGVIKTDVSCHYRIYSEEHALQKINTSVFPPYRNGFLAELLSCDYAELEDKTMQEKFKRLR